MAMSTVTVASAPASAPTRPPRHQPVSVSLRLAPSPRPHLAPPSDPLATSGAAFARQPPPGLHGFGVGMASSPRARRNAIVPLLVAVLCTAWPRASHATPSLRDVAATAVTAASILATHNATTDTPVRQYTDLTILGFVTPWNPSGVPRATREALRGRLDIVSPVQYTVTPSGPSCNPHDFPQGVLASLDRAGARVHPRFHFPPAAWPREDFVRLRDGTSGVARALVAECRTHGYDGVVLEAWFAAVAGGESGVEALMGLSDMLRETGVHTTLVLPPYARAHAAHGVDAKRVHVVSEHFSHVMVMTYDHGTPGGAHGALAPLVWVRAVTHFLAREARLGPKLLLGIPFYGVSFGGGGDRHVSGTEVLELLSTRDAFVRWDDEAAEHVVQTVDEQGRRAMTFIPSRASVAARVKLAREMGCAGIAIWEVGQGLDHFFEEL